MEKTINRITIHPIDTELLDKLRINHTSRVVNARVGSVVARLIKAGYKAVHVSNFTDDYNRRVIGYHCKKVAKCVNR